MRLYSLYNTIISFVLWHNVGTGRAAQFSKFEILNQETNNICTDNHIEWEMSTHSVSTCVIKCSSKSQCLGTVYKEDGHICYGLQTGNEADSCETRTAGGVIFWTLEDTCPPGWESISAWCYKIIDLNVWQDASDLCKSYSEVSHLAYVHTDEEHAAIQTWFQSIGKDDTTWIGGFRIDNTENWTWVDGVAITDDLPWGDEEPDNHYPTDCLRLYGTHVQFGDRDCMHVYSGLCELDIYN